MSILLFTYSVQSTEIIACSISTEDGHERCRAAIRHQAVQIYFKAPRNIDARSKNLTFTHSGKISFPALTLRSLAVLPTDVLGNK